MWSTQQAPHFRLANWLMYAWPWIFGNILPLHFMRQIGFAMFVAGVIR